MTSYWSIQRLKLLPVSSYKRLHLGMYVDSTPEYMLSKKSKKLLFTKFQRKIKQFVGLQRFLRGSGARKVDIGCRQARENV